MFSQYPSKEKHFSLENQKVRSRYSMLRKSILFVFAAAVLLALPAMANNLTVTLPEYSGPFYDQNTQFPLPSVTVGTFTYTIPSNEQIVSATVSGTFGNSLINTSALSNLFVAGIQVAACSSTSDPCFASSGPDGSDVTPWSYTFTASQLAALAGGSANFDAVQNSAYAVCLGTTTLDITYTPEPATLLELASGVIGIAMTRKRLF